MSKQPYVVVYRNHTSKLIYFLRSEGYSWDEIGEVIGIKAPAVQKIVRNNLGKKEKII